MDLGKALIIGVDLHGHDSSTEPKRIFCDVVLLDKSQSMLQPVLFQLKDNALSNVEDYHYSQNSGFTPIHRDDFMIVGEVIQVEKQKKLIHLKENITVSYNHLIKVSGSNQHGHKSGPDGDYTAGFQALVSALRLRKNVLKALTTGERNFLSEKERLAHLSVLSVYDPSEKNPCQAIAKLVLPKVTIPNTSLASLDKKLFEVQL